MKGGAPMNIPDPEKKIKDLYAKVPAQIKIAFASAIATGLMAHLYQFTNKLFNYDELYHTPEGTGEGIGLGRWGLYLAGSLIKHFFGNYSLPMVNGLLALFLIAVSACLIVRLFGIKSNVYAGLTGAVCTVFPVVTCTYFFMYTAPYYALALFLSSLSACLIVSAGSKAGGARSIRYLSAVILLTFATGIYQAYFSVAVCLCLGVLILEAPSCSFLPGDRTSDKTGFAEMVKKAFFYLSFLLLSLILYSVLNKTFLRVFNVTLPEYQGLNEMGKINLPFILERAVRSYAHALHLITSDVFKLNPTILVRLAFLIIFAAALLYIALSVVRVFKSGNKLCAALEAVFVLMYPIAMFLVTLMVTPDTYVYAIMLYPVVFAFILPLAVIDRYSAVMDEASGSLRLSLNVSNAISLICSLSVFASVLVYIWFANINYQAMQYTDFHDMAYYMAMMSKIKETEGFSDESPVIILGSTISDRTAEAGALIEQSLNLEGRSESNISAYSANSLFTKYLGFTPEFLWSDEDEERFSSDPRVLKMPCYPDDGSIELIDGVVVVKLEDIASEKNQ